MGRRAPALVGPLVGQFGVSVALSANGDVLAVGAMYENNNTGAVRVFEWDGSEYAPVGSPLTNWNSGDYAGTSVAMSADGAIIAVGGLGKAAVFWRSSATYVPRSSVLQATATLKQWH